MGPEFKKFTQAELIRANEILTFELVTKDGGQTFLAPYSEGSNPSYLDVNLFNFAQHINEEWKKVATNNEELAALIQGTISKQEAIANGWLPQPLNI